MLLSRGLAGTGAAAAAPRDVRCQAKKQSSSGQQNGRKQPQHGSSRVSSVAKMSDAARAAAKRANRFSQQRLERAVSTLEAAADLPLLDSSSNSTSISSPSTTLLVQSVEKKMDAETLQLQPYVEVITQHLKQTGALADAKQINGSNSSGSNSNGSNSSGRGRGAKRAATRSLLESHTAVFQAALDLELQEEWREAEERMKSWPVSRLVSEGATLFNLAAAPAGGVARDVLVRFFVPNKPLPYHSFSQGDIVLVSRGDPLGDSYEAVVVDFSSRWIRLALAPVAAAAVTAAAGQARVSSSSGWRLDLFANTVSHERCSEALKKFAGFSAGQQQQASGGLVLQQVVQQQEVLWRVLAGVIPQGQNLQSVAALPPPWIKSAQGRECLGPAKATIKKLVKQGQLNPSQARAIEAALTRTLTLWQGPPGTGKTTTLLRFCEAVMQLLKPVGGRVLAVAASNVAVDNLVAGLLHLGMKVVRVGQPVKVAPALRSVTLEVLAATTPSGRQAATLRQQLLATAAAGRSGSSSSNGAWQGGRRSSNGRRGGNSSSNSSSSSGQQGLWEQLLALEAAAAAEVLGAAEVVAATCVGAGDPVIAEVDFEVVVLDEATQAPEPAALVPLAARAQAVVMVGDPRQLSPTVKCQEAEQLGLGISMFDRLQAMSLQPLLLDVQYRMHPAICEFPAREFYGGLLQSWPKSQDRPLPPGLNWTNPQVPVMFFQCNGPESRVAAASSSRSNNHAAIGCAAGTTNGMKSTSDDTDFSSSSSVGGYSYSNASEAAAVLQCLKALVVQGQLAAAEVGVITPYSAQVRAIQQLLPAALIGATNGGSSRGSSIGRSHRASEASNNGNKTLTQHTTAASSSSDGNSSNTSRLNSTHWPLEVTSVDGFQGREKEVIIFSAVRSNARGRVGFLADARRLNVALTRAKCGLIVVGDARTLRNDPVWARWLAWAAEQGVVVTSLDVAIESAIDIAI